MAQPTFRVGKVSAYLRGSVWYLCYFENGHRRRPRVGTDRSAARELAAQINGQLETGAPAALSFESVSVAKLRARWLDHHEQVLRSSLGTISRYRTATDHLLRYVDDHPVRHAGLFQASQAAAFVRHLRSLKVSPNGHARTAQRPLMDKGLRFVLECSRAMFNFAAKRRYLPPYTENPFSALDIDKIPVETFRPVELLTRDQEEAFLLSCDHWQFPLFLTLMLTGLRPGELCHLLLPDDLDLEAGLLRVRNKPRLGWQVKTRNEREIPLVPALREVLRKHVGVRRHGPVFVRRQFRPSQDLAGWATSTAMLEKEISRRVLDSRESVDCPRTRLRKVAAGVWREIGRVPEDRIRLEFMRLMRGIGLPEQSAPKVLRHQFATMLQEARVDPLIRNILMGHAAASLRSAGHGLGMTAVYTHSRPETIRSELETAIASRTWLDRVVASQERL